MGLIGFCNEILYYSTIDAEALVSIRTSTAATNSRDAMLDAKSLTTLRAASSSQLPAMFDQTFLAPNCV
jgi:hypothetical protein